MFAKVFNVNTKKQLYLLRLEKLLYDELSIDYLFQEFRKIKIMMYNNMEGYDVDNKSNFNPIKSLKEQSSNSYIINNKEFLSLVFFIN